jgi:hypothetical protein
LTEIEGGALTEIDGGSTEIDGGCTDIVGALIDMVGASFTEMLGIGGEELI